jgi:hypothetical protein
VGVHEHDYVSDYVNDYVHVHVHVNHVDVYGGASVVTQRSLRSKRISCSAGLPRGV